jgi:hypothetical protein
MARLSAKRAPKRDAQVIDLLSSGASSPFYVQGFEKALVNISNAMSEPSTSFFLVFFGTHGLVEGFLPPVRRGRGF